MGESTVPSAINFEPRDINKIPLVFQWNKRDLPNVSSVDDLDQTLNSFNSPHFDAVALKGVGVFETLKTITKLVLLNLKDGL